MPVCYSCCVKIANKTYELYWILTWNLARLLRLMTWWFFHVSVVCSKFSSEWIFWSTPRTSGGVVQWYLGNGLWLVRYLCCRCCLLQSWICVRLHSTTLYFIFFFLQGQGYRPTIVWCRQRHKLQNQGMIRYWTLETRPWPAFAL